MKISFVIPAYNEELYIGKCLDSILEEVKERKVDYEIIVVNNASTDNTKKIASSYKEVKVIDEPQKSLVRARNTGYYASKGDIIANVDSDTMLTKGWVDKVVDEFSKDKKLVGLSGPFICHDVPKKLRTMVKIFYSYAYFMYIVNRFIFRVGSMFQGGNFVFRRSAFEKIGGYNIKKFSFYGEDADIAIRLFKVGKVKWTFKFPIYASGRRAAAEGPFTMAFRYTLNYFWALIFKRPFSDKVLDVRFKNHLNTLKIKPNNLYMETISAVVMISSLVIIPAFIIFTGYKYFSNNKVEFVEAKTKVSVEAKTINKKVTNFFTSFKVENP